MGFPVSLRHGPTRILARVLGLVLLATLVAGCGGGAVGQSPSSDDPMMSGVRQAAFQLDAVPAAPTSLKLDSLTPEEAQVSWTDNSSDETGFIIDFGLGGDEDWVELDRLGPDTTTYRVALNPVLIGLQIRVRVRAYNASGQSANSNLLAFTPSELPGTPQGLSAASPSSTEVFLSWQSSPVVSGGFRVERQTGTGPFLEIATTPGNEPRYLDTGLTPGTPYTYRVRAYNDAGTSGYSNTVTVTPGDDPNSADPPAAPTNVAVEVVPPTGIALTWTDNATDEDGYYIERRVEDGVFTRIATLGPDQTRFDDTGLSTDTTYTYLVIAFNSGGTSAGQPQPMVVVPSLPLAPSDLNAVLQSATEVELQWVNNAFNAEGVAIEQKAGSGDFVQVGTVDGLTTSWSDVSLVPGTVYTWRVRAYNDAGTSPWSNLATVTPPSLPAAPSGLSAAATSTTQVSLAWTDNSVDEDGFRIEVRTEDGDFTEWATLGASVTRHTLNDLAPGATYTFRVRAFNLAGSSAWSNEASVRLVSPPSPPTDLTATVISTTRVDLNWRDLSADETGFEIHRRVGAGGFVALATVGSGVETWTDTTAQVEETCVYRVRAQNEAGNSDWSNEATASLPEPPNAPSDLKATATSPTRVELTWQNPGTDPDDLEVERRIGQDAFTLVATVPGHADNWADEGLSPGTTATYRVRARNSSGSSGWSNEASATTLDVPQAPISPTNLTATLSSGHVLLRWSDNSSDETGFRLERQVGQGPFQELATLGANSTSFTDSAPILDPTCTYRVLAFNGEALSGYSNLAPALASSSRLVLGLGDLGKGWIEAFDLVADGEPVHAAWLGAHWPAYSGSIPAPAYTASGDVDGDGLQELVVGLGARGQGRVLVLDDATTGHTLLGWLQVSWAAYNNSGEAPTHPTCADLDGDGIDEVVVGLGDLGQGWVQVFQHGGGGQFHPFLDNGGWAQVQWTDYTTSGKAPVWPAGGDFNADGRDEVALGLGSGGRGWTQILTCNGSALVPFAATAPFSDEGWVSVGWSTYQASGEASIYPAAGDLDHDGKADLVLGLGGNAAGWLRVFRSTGGGFEPMPGTANADGWLQVPWRAYTEAPQASTRPTCGDLNGDGGDDLAVGLGPDGQGWVYTLQGRTFIPAEGPGFYGWLQVRWGAYLEAQAPTWPTILNQRSAPLSFQDLSQPPCRPGGPDPDLPRRTA